MSAALRAYAERQAVKQAEAAAAATVDDENPTHASSSLDAPLVGKKVTITGLLARPDLNGCTGRADSFDASNGRYAVSLPTGESVALRSANLSAVSDTSSDATAFAPQTRIRIKGLTSKPELNECGGKVLGWNAEKARFVIELDGSLKTMLVRASNLERDRREAWEPEMHTPSNMAHIKREVDRYMAEQAANMNPFGSMDPTGELFKKAQENDNAG